ncbi:hypothetical protein TNCV_2172501 [Trichonephila clavipes]|nr:hypothetical protein TNCV_2172501 [Trichonephila clavipes]
MPLNPLAADPTISRGKLAKERVIGSAATAPIKTAVAERMVGHYTRSVISSPIRSSITQADRVFSSIVRDFLELFYNLWRTVLAKNKIVLDPALRLQSFRTPENATIGVRSGVECQQQERWRPSSRLF